MSWSNRGMTEMDKLKMELETMSPKQIRALDKRAAAVGKRAQRDAARRTRADKRADKRRARNAGVMSNANNNGGITRRRFRGGDTSAANGGDPTIIW